MLDVEPDVCNDLSDLFSLKTKTKEQRVGFLFHLTTVLLLTFGFCDCDGEIAR